MAGPTLGGWLVTDYSWRWIFFVNVPIGIIALILAFDRDAEHQAQPQAPAGPAGRRALHGALFLIVYGLIEGQSHDWGKVWGPITIR